MATKMPKKFKVMLKLWLLEKAWKIRYLKTRNILMSIDFMPTSLNGMNLKLITQEEGNQNGDNDF